ncbi:hypothetical protein R3P38DRAFT_2758167 [Favolaschia claudopus]|uniref:Uncharacterized protein n=1 Tax=Favolaschia claudopus TaxID=2862362 RepID=A0AAW0E8T6_9AGAR
MDSDAPDEFGVHEVFSAHSSHDPEDTLGLDYLCGSAGFATAAQATDLLADIPAWFPFFNPTIASLMAWFHLDSLKSIADLDALIHSPKMTIKEKESVQFEVEGFVYRPVLDVMVESFPLQSLPHNTIRAEL